MTETTEASLRRPLSVRVHDATTLDETTLRELWRFRLQFMKLKPHVSEAEDFEDFRGFFRQGKFALIGRDPSGQVQTMLGLRALHAPGNAVLWNWGAAFTALSHRQNPKFYVAVAQILAKAWLSFPGRSMYSIGWAYLPTFIAWRASLPTMWTLHDPRITAEQRALLTWFCEQTGGASWDRRTFLREATTIPLPLPYHPPSRPLVRRAVDEYLRINPAWRQGYAVAVAAPLSPGQLLTALRLSLLRLLRPPRRVERG